MLSQPQIRSCQTCLAASHDEAEHSRLTTTASLVERVCSGDSVQGGGIALHLADGAARLAPLPASGSHRACLTGVRRHAGKAITLRAALARYVDLLSPVSKPALQALSAFAAGEEQAHLRRLLSPDGAAEYKAWHQQSRSLLEAMEEFSSCRPPLGEQRLSAHFSPHHSAAMISVHKCTTLTPLSLAFSGFPGRLRRGQYSSCRQMSKMPGRHVLSWGWLLVQARSSGPSCSACKSASTPSPPRLPCTQSPSTSPAQSST